MGGAAPYRIVRLRRAATRPGRLDLMSWLPREAGVAVLPGSSRTAARVAADDDVLERVLAALPDVYEVIDPAPPAPPRPRRRRGPRPPG